MRKSLNDRDCYAISELVVCLFLRYYNLERFLLVCLEFGVRIRPAFSFNVISLKSAGFNRSELPRVKAVLGLVNQNLASVFPITSRYCATIWCIRFEQRVSETFSVGLISLLPLLMTNPHLIADGKTRVHCLPRLEDVAEASLHGLLRKLAFVIDGMAFFIYAVRETEMCVRKLLTVPSYDEQTFPILRDAEVLCIQYLIIVVITKFIEGAKCTSPLNNWTKL